MNQPNDAAYLADVLAFVAAGYAVFPVRNKRPLIAEGFKKASSDPGVVEGWWRQYGHPDFAWALPEGVLAVDVDDPAAFAETGLDLPRTAWQPTRREGGKHLLYQLPPDVKPKQVAKAYPGIDYRVGGDGYVVLYEPQRLLAPRAPAETWMTRRDNGVSDDIMAGEVPERLGTRDEILSLLGSIAALGRGLNQEYYIGILNGMRAQGVIVALDENRKWTDEDIIQLAGEAVGWDLRAAADKAWAAQFKAKLEAYTAREAASQAEGAFRRLASIEALPTPPLILDRWCPDGPSMLYGTGGVGKGRLASQEIARYTREDSSRSVLIVDYEDHLQEWRHRLEDCGGRLDQVIWVAPHGSLWNGPRGGFPEQADTIASAAREFGVSWVVIDSAMMALPGYDVGDPAAPSRWAEALQHIGLPSLTLAHVTKADDDPRYPFGSIFWHNLARITWGLAENKAGDLILKNHKHNNYADSDYPWSYQLESLEDVAGRIQLASGYWNLRRYSEVRLDRVQMLLEAGPLTVAEIISGLELVGDKAKANVIRSLLSKNREVFTVADSRAHTWKLAD